MVVHTARLVSSSILIFLLGLLSTSVANAQPALEPGYILTTSGDTTRGVIDNRKWQRPPEQVQFAESRDASLQTFEMSEIAGFGVGAYVFERHIVDVDRRPVELNKPYPSDAITRRDTLFLQRLVDGPMRLYHAYTQRPHYFVETSEAELNELVYFLRPVVGRQGAKRVDESTYYREQLRARRTQACADASVSRVDYTRKDLVAFAASCDPDFDGTTAWTESRNFRMTHVFSVRMNRTASQHPTRLRAGTGTMTGLSPGAQYQLLLEMGERNSSGGLLVGIGIQRMTASASSETVTTQNGRRGTTVGDLSATVLDLSTEFRIRLTDAKWRPFVGVETAFMFPLSYEASYRIALEQDERFSVASGARNWNTMQVGAGAGIGVEGRTVGGRLGLLYGFPVVRADREAPKQVDVELQVFLKF